jgi:hypothetical protein
MWRMGNIPKTLELSSANISISLMNSELVYFFEFFYLYFIFISMDGVCLS